MSVVSVTSVVYFHVNVTCFAAEHLKFDSHYSNLIAPGADTNRLLLLTRFLSARCAHNLGMNLIYKGIAVLESKFHFEVKD